MQPALSQPTRQHPEPAFTDAPFMTAADKERVLRAWERFLKHGLQQKHFSKRLYEHLHLHCGFIAHYNIHGFYAEYFQAGQDTERFLENFREGATSGRDYDDLNTAMLKVLDQHQAKLSRNAEQDIHSRLELLDAAVRRARTDRSFARQLLDRINF